MESEANLNKKFFYKPMPSAIEISILALLVSSCSFGIACWVALRDRAKILASSTARMHERTGEYSSVFISITNAGRRPINIVYLWGKYEDKSQGGIRFSDTGTILKEGDIHELEFGKFDGMMINSETFSPLVSVVIKDNTGRCHTIKDINKNIALVAASKHPFGTRTHG